MYSIQTSNQNTSLAKCSARLSCGYLKLKLHKAPHWHKAHIAQHYVRKIECAIEQFFFQNFFQLHNSIIITCNFSNSMWSFLGLQLQMAYRAYLMSIIIIFTFPIRTSKCCQLFRKNPNSCTDKNPIFRCTLDSMLVFPVLFFLNCYIRRLNKYKCKVSVKKAVKNYVMYN